VWYNINTACSFDDVNLVVGAIFFYCNNYIRLLCLEGHLIISKEEIYMFQINDIVVYGTTGVCRVTNITKEKYRGNEETEYYVLQPIFSNKMVIKTPVNNQKVVMRNIITKNDVLSLIDTFPQEGAAIIENDRERSELCKAALKTGDSEEWVKVIKILKLEEKEKSAAGKKLNKIDEEIMKAAEKQLFEEFAIVLEISPEEVHQYIKKRIS
jgi:CarD family transcriptional regulator